MRARIFYSYFIASVGQHRKISPINVMMVILDSMLKFGSSKNLIRSFRMFT